LATSCDVQREANCWTDSTSWQPGTPEGELWSRRLPAREVGRFYGLCIYLSSISRIIDLLRLGRLRQCRNNTRPRLVPFPNQGLAQICVVGDGAAQGEAPSPHPIDIAARLRDPVPGVSRCRRLDQRHRLLHGGRCPGPARCAGLLPWSPPPLRRFWPACAAPPLPASVAPR
jgi:hypothetical protein